MKINVIGIKEWTAFALVLIGFGSASAQEKFTVQGSLTGVKESKLITLLYVKNNKYVSDSVITQDGKFTITSTVPWPMRATISMKANTNVKATTFDEQGFFLEGGTITITGTDRMSTATIKGGPAQDENLLLNSQLLTLKEKSKKLREQNTQYAKLKDSVSIKKNNAELESVQLETVKIQNEFIGKHPNSYVSLLTVKLRGIVMDPVTFEPLFNLLNEKLRTSEDGLKLSAKLAKAKNTTVGTVMNFTQTDVNDKPFALSSLKGKYVLVDFWASWCGPCRAENPNVIKAYKTLKDKNFEIVGVSLDTKKEQWLKAIGDDKLPWIQVSDLQGFKNNVARQYGINAIPQNFLVDPNGIIIARNLRGEELYKKLALLIP